MKRKLLTICLALMGMAFAFAQTGSVTLKVNMQYAIDEGKFNPSADYVDVAGSFNGWDGKDHHLTSEDNVNYSITIDNLTPGTVYEYKFRINGSWDADKHEFPNGGPNRKFTAREGAFEISKIFNNYAPGYVPVTIKVNMSVWAELGKFNPETDFVDVAGTFNGWGPSDELFDGDDKDLIYTGIIIAPSGQDMEFKCRINGSWDADKHEFPNGGPNRKYSVLDTTGGVTNVVEFYFNDDSLPTAVNSVMANEVSLYPNPVANVLNIKSANAIQKVAINDLTGRQVLVRLANAKELQIAVNELSSGSYFVTILGANGNRQVVKIVKY